MSGIRTGTGDKKQRMGALSENIFFENAQKIFDVARSGTGEQSSDFALMIRPDGGLHLLMDSPLSLEAAAVHGGAQAVYHVQHSRGGVRVTGQAPGQTCVLEDAGLKRSDVLRLRDQPLYQLMSGNGGGSSRGGASVECSGLECSGEITTGAGVSTPLILPA